MCVEINQKKSGQPPFAYHHYLHHFQPSTGTRPSSTIMEDDSHDWTRERRTTLAVVDAAGCVVAAIIEPFVQSLHLTQAVVEEKEQQTRL